MKTLLLSLVLSTSALAQSAPVLKFTNTTSATIAVNTNLGSTYIQPGATVDFSSTYKNYDLGSFLDGVSPWLDTGVLTSEVPNPLNALLLSGVPASTTANLNLYLDPNGSDNGSCTSPGKPCRTCAGVLSKIPRTIRHLVTVYAAPGYYSAPSSWLGYTMSGACDFSGINLVTDNPNNTDPSTVVWPALSFIGWSQPTYPTGALALLDGGNAGPIYTIQSAVTDQNGILTTITINPDGGNGGLFPTDGGLENTYLCFTWLDGSPYPCGGYNTFVDLQPVISNTVNTVTFLSQYGTYSDFTPGDAGFVFDTETSRFSSGPPGSAYPTAGAVFYRGPGSGQIEIANVALDTLGGTGIQAFASSLTVVSVLATPFNGNNPYFTVVSEGGAQLGVYGLLHGQLPTTSGPRVLYANNYGYINAYYALLETTHGTLLYAGTDSEIVVAAAYMLGVGCSSSYQDAIAIDHSLIYVLASYSVGSCATLTNFGAYDSSMINIQGLFGNSGGTIPFFAQDHSTIVIDQTTSNGVTNYGSFPDAGYAIWPDGGDEYPDAGGFWIGLGTNTSYTPDHAYSRTQLLQNKYISDPVTFSIAK